MAFDATGQRDGEAQVTRLLDVMPAGFYSLDRMWRFSYVNATAERLLGHPREELLGQVAWQVFADSPGSDVEAGYRNAVATGQAVSLDAHFPPPLDAWYEHRAWPTPEGLSVYIQDITARRTAQLRAERSAARVALLAQVSAELASTLDVRAATAGLPRLLTPVLADWCVVSVLDDAGRPEDVGCWHADPWLRPVVTRYSGLRRPAMPTTPLATWSMTHREPWTGSFEESLALLAPGEAHDLFTELAPAVVITLAMRGRGRTLGLLTLCCDAGRTPTDEDLATAQGVADRAGLALDNARLHAQQQLAEELQRSLLTEPPELGNAEIVARYLPAVEAARVGGDWYDAFEQPDGATVVVIGDVAGHDIAAARAMGQLRGLLRGIATYSNAAPAEVLRGLDASMAVLQAGTLATATVARFEQTDEERDRGVGRMVWSNAGHLPPVAVDPDGVVRTLGGRRADLLLGVDPTVARTESAVTLDRGSTVVLCTDGLVERRDADLDSGLERLRRHLAALADRPLPQLCDELLERLVDGRPDGDVALIAVRWHRQDRPRPGLGSTPGA